MGVAKLEFLRLSAILFRRLGVEMEAGVLSGGRMGDIGGSPEVDRTIDEAMEGGELGRLEGSP